MEEAQKYLNDKKSEKFPKELFIPRGPSNNVYKYLFDYNFNFSNNKGVMKKQLEDKKRKVIFGVLQLCYFILKNIIIKKKNLNQNIFLLNYLK